LPRPRGGRSTFIEGDAEALPFADGAFDAVISTFGVMFVQRPEDAASELARICRPGGRLVLAVWTPDGNVFEMFKIIKSYMPAPNGTPPPSPFEWGRPERLQELLGTHFDLTIEDGTSFYREPDGAAAWRHFVSGYGPVRALAGKLDPERRARFEADFTAFHDGFADQPSGSPCRAPTGSSAASAADADPPENQRRPKCLITSCRTPAKSAIVADPRDRDPGRALALGASAAAEPEPITCRAADRASQLLGRGRVQSHPDP
jgi:hypothetical protein